MDLIATVMNAFVIVAVGAVLAYVASDRFKMLRHGIDSLRGDMKRLEDRIDAGLASVHSEIVQVALAVGARPRAAQG